MATKRLNRSIGTDIFIGIVLFVAACFMAMPLVYAISSSLKPLNELWIFPPRFLVQNPTSRNFSDLFMVMSNSWVPFSRYIFNTVFISVVGTAGHVILASMCAYAICKIRFKGANIVFQIVVYSLMFSAAVTQVPNFLVIKTLGLMDNYLSLILPALSSSLGLYLMKQFMETMVHDTIIEASRIDGASNYKIFWSVVMPMVKPAWLTLIIFSFQGLWNMGQNMFIHSEELKSLNYAISQIVAAGIARAGTASAAAVIMMVPPIAVFIITQSNVIETMSTSGMKD